MRGLCGLLGLFATLVAAVGVFPQPAAPEPGPSQPSVAFKRPRHDHPLPDAKVARGTRNVLAAWFSDPVTRHRHFVLGAEHEPSSLVVSTADRRILKLTLPSDSVFEDREPLIADVDGDGADEIVVVRSYAKTGAVLAVVAVRAEGLAIVAETPPTGIPFSWLNPAGVADFDGDGRPDIALVRTPHVDGKLEIWTLRAGRLELLLTSDDVSNHVSGSPHQRLSAITDFDGDGIPDLAIPSADRRTLRFLSMKGGKVRELARVFLPGPASEDFRLVAKGTEPAVEVGLSGGRKITVAPR
jgi:hypothetical protein